MFITVMAAVLTAGAVFGVFAFALDRTAGLRPSVPDGVRPLPDGEITPQDLSAAQFDVALRGYRMKEVDTTVRRAAQELERAQKRVRELEQQLREAQESDSHNRDD